MDDRQERILRMALGAVHDGDILICAWWTPKSEHRSPMLSQWRRGVG